MDSISLNKVLSEWIQNRPVWFSYVFNDAIKLKEIDENDIERYSKLCLEELEGNNLESCNIDFEELNLGHENEKTSILEIYNMENVNAITAERALKFSGEGLTVVYGDNGSGKTGYVRALKKACGVAGSEPIKKNIYDLKIRYMPPKCHIKLSTIKEPIECRLDSDAKASIKGVSIFDTKISNDYIGNIREASFEPKIFRILSKFAKAIDSVKNNLSRKKHAVQSIVPEMPIELISASIFEKYKNINTKTILVDSDFIWLEDDEIELSSQKNRLNETNPESKIQQLNKQYESLELINQYTHNLKQVLSEKKQKRIDDYSFKIKQLSTEYEVLSSRFSENANDLDRSSQESTAWRNLWKYAREYYGYLTDFEKNHICPLCNQKMNEGVVSRYNTIDEYVNNKLIMEIEELKAQIKKELEISFSLLDEETIQVLWNSVMKQGQTTQVSLSKLVLLSSGLKNIKNYDDVDAYKRLDSNNNDLSDILSMLKKRKDILDEDKRVLIEIKKGNRLTELKSAIIELEARKFLNNHKEKYLQLIDSIKEIELYESAEKTAVTNAITRQTSLLSSELLLKDYEDRFNSELKKLTNGKVKVKLIKAKAGKGRVPFKIIVEDASGGEHNPNEILSEGEQRVVSIAAYIADNLIGESFGPFVFDDPISSLDFEYEGSTINRIADLAKIRQVIVFTHRISMVCALKEACKNIKVQFNDVSIISTDKLKGIPTTGILQKAKVKESLNRMLKNDIPHVKKQDIASRDYHLSISGLCSDFRAIVEKSIEDILMCGITARFERNIHSANVLRLRRLRDYDSEIVDKMMTKYSFSEHSHSDETPYALPDLYDIENDIGDFILWSTEAQLRLTK